MLSAVIVALCFCVALSEVTNDFYSFSVKDAEGSEYDLENFRGKVRKLRSLTHLSSVSENAN
jgi:hypothetical protein